MGVEDDRSRPVQGKELPHLGQRFLQPSLMVAAFEAPENPEICLVSWWVTRRLHMALTRQPYAIMKQQTSYERRQHNFHFDALGGRALCIEINLDGRVEYRF